MSLGKSPKDMTTKELTNFYKIFSDEEGRLKQIMQQHQAEKMVRVVRELRRRGVIDLLETQSAHTLAQAIYGVVE